MENPRPEDDDPAMAGIDLRVDSYEAIAARLRLLREAWGYGDRRQADFARWVEIRETAWNNYEKGNRLIPPHQALKLSAKTGATLNWIYGGEETDNKPVLQEKLARLRSEQARSRKARA
jgi:DNA-binding XRE family transcriptional regulator